MRVRKQGLIRYNSVRNGAAVHCDWLEPVELIPFRLFGFPGEEIV
jgi:hypothetical protein